jgi:membrane-associated phospholipid phosphatase
MNRTFFVILSGFILLGAESNFLSGQDSINYSIQPSFKLKNQILPSALIVTGLVLLPPDIKQTLQDAIPRTDTQVDDYLQWAPIGVMYVSDIFTDRHQNNLFNQTKYLTISLLATAGITQILKKLTHVTRPNGGTLSFPSGHTSNAFASATVLFHEYRDYNVFIAGSGYVFSTATGVLRVTNNAHWVPDVLVGAGIGIIVTNLVYYIEPFKRWDPFGLAKNDKIAFYPDLDFDRNIYCMSLKIKIGSDH